MKKYKVLILGYSNLAKNRLINTWQILVQDITNGDGAFGKFIKNALNGLNKIVQKLGLIGGSEDLKFQGAVIKAEEEVEAEIEASVRYRLKKEGKIIKDVTDEIYETRSKILLSKTKKEKATHEKHLAELISLQISQNKIIEAEKKQIAAEEISLAVSNYKSLKKLYNEDKEALENFEKEKQLVWETYNQKNYKENKKLYGEKGAIRRMHEAEKKWFNTSWDDNEKKLKENLQKSGSDFALWTAKFDKFRKLLQESDVQTLPKKKIGKGIDTSDLDLKIANLKNSIKNINNFISLPETDINMRLQSLKVLFDLEDKLITVQRDKQIRLANENKNKEEIASVNHQQKLFEIDQKWGKKKTKLEQDFLQDGLKEIASSSAKETNVKLIALREEFEKIKNVTKKHVTKYKADEAAIKREGNNKQLQEQADFLISWLEILKISGKERIDIERQIQEILAKIKADPTYKDKLKDTLEDELELYKKFMDEIGNLVDAVLSKKLESIDAEIRAEENKYDKLITLAGDDESKRAALEKQKEDKIAILEKRRLKQEQKIAKARKAFAIAEIAINTAIAISKAATLGPILGIPAVAWAKALGALQLAAVLATPIPQYKDGIESVPNDQVAMINDGGVKEYVERDGKILTTSTKNAIVNLKKNDTVHKNYDDMVNNSKAGLIISGGAMLNQNQFDKLAETLESSIYKGFSKAKINNTTVVKQKGNDYLNEKSRF